MPDETTFTHDRTAKFPLCRLWERQGANGTYLSGTLGGARVLVVANTRPNDEQDAPWLLVIGPNDPQPTSSEGTQR